jgi:hypothetical protein
MLAFTITVIHIRRGKLYLCIVVRSSETLGAILNTMGQIGLLARL